MHKVRGTAPGGQTGCWAVVGPQSRGVRRMADPAFFVAYQQGGSP